MQELDFAAAESGALARFENVIAFVIVVVRSAAVLGRVRIYGTVDREQQQTFRTEPHLSQGNSLVVIGVALVFLTYKSHPNCVIILFFCLSVPFHRHGTPLIAPCDE